MSKNAKMVKNSIIYHYTSLENFMKIIEFGTLRFKLSTSSNDVFDTIYMQQIIKDKLSQYNLKSSSEKNRLFKFMLNYFVRDDYKSTEDAFVICFSEKQDSRLLWDAYTINRPGEMCKYGEHKKCIDLNMMQYDGVCIGFDKNKLCDYLNGLKTQLFCNEAILGKVYYDKKSQDKCLQSVLDNSWKYYMKIKNECNEDQNIIPTQIINPIMNMDGDNVFLKPLQIKLHKSFVLTSIKFINYIQRISPFIKHEFWKEEKEVRAVIYRHINDKRLLGNISGYENNKYIDIPITEEIINYIIVGPTFDKDNMKKLRSINNAKLNIDIIKVQHSKGTGVIRNQ